MRLLIAEDDLDLAEALDAFLEKNQYTVDAVHDGAAALDYAGTGEYDAIIMDIMMPKLIGIDELSVSPPAVLPLRAEIRKSIAQTCTLDLLNA